MLNKCFQLIVVGCLLLMSCSKDDEPSESNFYSDAKTSATTEQIHGTWAIYKVSYEGVMAPVPINYTACGRDFIVFSKDGIYSEFMFKSSDCQFDQNSLTWNLDKGVIKIFDSYEFEELVITQVSSNELVVKMQLDVDDDGKLDIVYAYLQRYTPNKFDVVSNTFTRNNAASASHLINYTWQAYNDADIFMAYEVYRSTGESCSKEQAVLIQTITDISTTEFIDHNPPEEQLLCYFLKTKIRSGTLGESETQMLNTYTLEVKPVNLNKPVVQDKTINFEWEESDSPYFSHYEITYSNFPNNVTGHGQQVVNVATIYDQKVTQLNHQQLPYLENPKYNLRVYNIFGNSTYANPQGYKTTWEVEHHPDELLPMYTILSYVHDTTEPVIYLYGYTSEGDYEPKIVRYNYESFTTEAISTQKATTSTELSIEVIISPEGKELILEQGNALHVYDATSLVYKHLLTPTEVTVVNDFKYTTAGYWIITDITAIRSYKRSGSSFTLVDSKPHFSNHQSIYNYTIVEIENDQLIVGHINEPKSRVYHLTAQGMLEDVKLVDLPIKAYGVRQVQYNPKEHVIVNYKDNIIYSTLNFTAIDYFQQPQVGNTISKDGNWIYGSNNDPSWSLEDTSPHLKEAIFYNRSTKQVQSVPTKGYPMWVFQSPSGGVYSISSGLKKSTLQERISYTKDLFVERL